MLRIVTASSYSQSQYLHINPILYVLRKYKMNIGTTNHIFISIKSAYETFTIYNNCSIDTVYNNCSIDTIYTNRLIVLFFYWFC